MAVNAGVIGKTYPATTYAVGREKVREYALAVGETNALYLDVVVAGDEITTTATVSDVTQRAGRGFFVFESTSTNQRGETVCVGRWTNIVRSG